MSTKLIWKTYTNSASKFTFKYPPEYKLFIVPRDTYNNSLAIHPEQNEWFYDYSSGKSINVLWISNDSFKIRESDNYQDLVYSKFKSINNQDTLQQILIGIPPNYHAPDATHINTQIKSPFTRDREYIVVSFTTGLYEYIEPDNKNYLLLSDSNWEIILNSKLEIYNQILSTFEFLE